MTEKGPKLKNPMTKDRKLNKAVPKTGFQLFVPEYAKCYSGRLYDNLMAIENKTDLQKRIATLERAADSVKDAVETIKEATQGTDWEAPGLGIASNLEQLVDKRNDGNSVLDILSDMIKIEKVESSKRPKSSPKKRGAQTAFTFVAKLIDGTKPEIRFRKNRTACIGELCIGAKREIVLQSEHTFSEMDAEYYAKIVFEKMYRNKLKKVTRKTDSVPKDA